MMKKIIVLLLIITGVQSTFAQKDAVIMEIDGKPVTKSEFLQIYLKNNPNPTEEDIENFMTGNICRCGTYTRIKKAIQLAATK